MHVNVEDWTVPSSVTSIYSRITSGLSALWQFFAIVCNAIKRHPIYIKISSNHFVIYICEAIRSNPTVLYLRSSVVYTYNSMRRKETKKKQTPTARILSLCWYFGIFCGMVGMMYLSTSLFPTAGTKIVTRNYSPPQQARMLAESGKKLSCRRVEVVGLPGSGTNWLQYNLRANLEDISVTFKEEHGAPVPYESSPVWKHTYISQWHLLEDQTFLVDDTFFIVIVRDPNTWIQSVARTPKDYTQVYTKANIWTSFTWTEIDEMNIVKLPDDGGIFDVNDYNKPILIRVSTTKSDRPAAMDRLADRWVVFPNIVDAWNEFHRGWLEALSPPASGDTKKVLQDAMDNVDPNKSPNGIQLPGPEFFHHPGGWRGVFVSYEALLEKTESVLRSLEKVIRDNVQPRDVEMTENQRKPEVILGLDQKWVQSGNYWILASHVPVVSEEKFEALRQKPVGISDEVQRKITERVSSVAAKLEKRFI